MFELLTRLLLWALIAGIVYYVFIQFIPREYLTWLGGLLIFVFVVVAFLDPADRTAAIVWSVLSIPLKPLGLTILLLASAMRKGIKGIAGNQVLAALLILLLSSTPIVAYWLAAQTQQSARDRIGNQNTEVVTATPVSAIVVLGDGNNPSDAAYQTRTQLSQSQNGFGTSLVSRLYVAGEEYNNQLRLGSDPFVIVTAIPQAEAASEEARNTQQEAQRQTIVDLLVGEGVRSDRIQVDFTGGNVRSSAIEVSRILTNAGVATNNGFIPIVLVTPTITARRAVSTFSREGLQVVTRTTDRFAFQLDRPDGRLALISDLVPNVEALALTTRVVDEYLASIYYFLRGWLLNPLAF